MERSKKIDLLRKLKAGKISVAEFAEATKDSMPVGESAVVICDSEGMYCPVGETTKFTQDQVRTWLTQKGCTAAVFLPDNGRQRS